MSEKETRPCGSWSSPISARDIAAGTMGFQQIAVDGDDVYWIETRPAENGRYVIVKWNPQQGAIDITPRGYSARSLVNSYGGGSMTVANGSVYFTNFDPKVYPSTNDQRIYRQDPGMLPVAITPQLNMSYADGIVDAKRGLLICVREDAGTLLHGQPQQALVGIDLEGRKLPVVIAEGHDFYASPSLSRDGDRLAWISWNYPCMPWDGTELFVAELDRGGHVSKLDKIAGEPGKPPADADNRLVGECACYSSESIMQPRWSPDDTLYFISDRYRSGGSRWWNFYRYRGGRVEAVTEQAREFGAPMWQLGVSHYDFDADGHLIGAYTEEGRWQLVRIDTDSGKVRDIDSGYSSIDQIHVQGGRACFIGGAFDAPGSVLRLELSKSGGAAEVLRQSIPEDMFAKIKPSLSTPQFIRFPTGDSGDEEAYAFFYPPANARYKVADDERPPLLIFIHGGPSAGISAAMSLNLQYFTSRGFAVVDVIYRGSTGFGREYHQALYGYWGQRDVDDCVNAARYLIAQDRVDRYRIASRGGSAGGYTTLALATFSDILTAATSYYGISNLEMIAIHTDKLEAHYAEMLVGPYPAAQKQFQARSPYFHADRINCPMVLFQGCDDPVVPPEQARVLIEELLKKGMPVGYEFYPGESHGFRMQAHIQKSLEGELYFYSQIMNFTPAEPLQAVPLYNWPPGSGGGGVPEVDFPCG